MVLLIAPFISNAQTAETVSIGAGYTEQVWYDLETGTQTSRSASEWDLAFEIQGFTSSILVNNQKAGVVLYEAPYTVGDWGVLDTMGIGTWEQLQNDPTSWSKGAFNQGLTSDSLDLGWGNYNFITHIVTGDSLYVISLANGEFKKLRIDALAGGQYLFTYANLDGTNETTATIDKMGYMDKNFAYYSIENDVEIDREPNNSEWDLTFVKYIDFVPVPYAVTGVLVNKWAQSGNVSNTPVGMADWINCSFDVSMNGVGFDWKDFNMTTFQWELQDSLTYFVESTEGNIWELVFTGFGGSANGEFLFDVQQVSATDVVEIESDRFEVYPNPTTGQLNLEFPNGFDRVMLQVRDMSGRIVRSLSLNGAVIALEFGDLPNGMYLIQANNEANVVTARVMIEK